jgi:hypothetical protein
MLPIPVPRPMLRSRRLLHARHTMVSPVSSPARASSRVAEKTATPARNSPPLEHTTSSPDVDIDTGAHQGSPDTSADIRGTRTEDNTGASNMSASTDKEKAPEQPVVGMTYGACQGPSYLSAGVPGVSTALEREDRLRPKGRLH